MSGRMKKGMFSSSRDDWETPQDLFDRLNRMFAFELDVAADAQNHKVESYFDRERNGLVHEWANRNWMNPPYGKEIVAWVEKADAEGKKVKLTVALLPARTDTRWYHKFCAQWHSIFLRGRLRFSGLGSAPFPSVLVFFGIPR